MLSIMNRVILGLGFICALLGSAEKVSAASTGEVTYIASEGVYINAGTNDGIQIGDSLALVAKKNSKDTVAIVVITQVSSRSAASRIILERRPVKIGFFVLLPKTAKGKAKPGARKSKVVSNKKPSESAPTRNIVRGSASFGVFWHGDYEESSRNFVQPEGRVRLKVDKIGGSDLTLSFRTRSVYTYHTSFETTIHITDRWRHRLSEFSLTHKGSDGQIDWGVGRVFPSEMRGMGYIDGAYYARNLSGALKVGVAAGAVPSVLSSWPRPNRKKLGGFISYSHLLANVTKAQLSAALSSEFEQGVTSRDFLYLQATISRAELFTLTQSSEIDWNRAWRYSRSNKRLNFTNYFGSLDVTASRKISGSISLDARKNILRYIDSAVPDSLFDDQVRKSLRVGLRVRASKTVRISSSAGIRYREGLLKNNRFLRISVNAKRFPRRNHSASASLSMFESRFTTGYRPRVDYRIPLKRQTRLRMSVGGVFSSYAGESSSEAFLDVGVVHRLAKRYTLDLNSRRYFSADRSALEVYFRISSSFGK